MQTEQSDCTFLTLHYHRVHLMQLLLSISCPSAPQTNCGPLLYCDLPGQAVLAGHPGSGGDAPAAMEAPPFPGRVADHSDDSLVDQNHICSEKPLKYGFSKL